MSFLLKILLDINLSTVFISCLTGLFFTLPCLFAIRKASSYTYRYSQCFLELIHLFLDKSIKSSLGENIDTKDYIVTWCLIFSSFLWIITMNLLDVFPSFGYEIVPTTNFSLCLALAFMVLIHMLFVSIRSKGFLGYIKYSISHPFGYFWIIPNLIYNFIDKFMKPLFLGIRLFFNMYTGEIVKNILLGMPFIVSLPGCFLWTLFHVCIGCFQSFIFITLSLAFLRTSLLS